MYVVEYDGVIILASRDFTWIIKAFMQLPLGYDMRWVARNS